MSEARKFTADERELARLQIENQELRRLLGMVSRDAVLPETGDARVPLYTLWEQFWAECEKVLGK